MITINIDPVHILLAGIAVCTLLYSIYNKIRFECVKKASEMVASVEQNKDLTGEQKFATVLDWIDQSLPGIFKNSLIRNVSKQAVQQTYDNSKEYMENYIKRKTGVDVSDIISKYKAEQFVKENNGEDDRILDIRSMLKFERYIEIDEIGYPLFSNNQVKYPTTTSFLYSGAYWKLQNICEKNRVTMEPYESKSYSYQFYLKGEIRDISNVLHITGMDELCL